MAFVTKTARLRTNADGDGAASIRVRGILHAIDVKKGTLASGAADITIKDQPSNVTILTLTNVAADARHYPSAQHTNATGTARESGTIPDGNGGVKVGSFRAPVVFGYAHITVAQGGDTKEGSVTLLIER